MLKIKKINNLTKIIINASLSNIFFCNREFKHLKRLFTTRFQNHICLCKEITRRENFFTRHMIKSIHSFFQIKFAREISVTIAECVTSYEVTYKRAFDDVECHVHVTSFTLLQKTTLSHTLRYKKEFCELTHSGYYNHISRIPATTSLNMNETCE